MITLIIVSAVALVAFVILLVLLSRDEPAPSPPPPTTPGSSPTTHTPTPTPTPDATPTPEPTPGGESSPQREDALVANPVYAVDVPQTQCREITALPTNGAQMESYGQEWMNCLTEAWTPVVTNASQTWQEPQFLVFETETIQSACGNGGRAFYCSADNTVYLGTALLNELPAIQQFVPVAYFYVITHEFHHHIQNNTGIINAMLYEYDQDPYEGMRRLELQDQCWVSMAFRQAGLEMTPELQENWKSLLSRSTSQQHGDADSTVYWGSIGLEARTMAPCNTWTAASEDVS